MAKPIHAEGNSFLPDPKGIKALSWERVAERSEVGWVRLNAECRIAPHGALTVTVFPPPLCRCYRRDTACRVRPFFTPESLFLALLEREGGIRRMTGGSIFLTFISNLPFTRPALLPLWHILCPERQRMQSALFYRHDSSFSEYTCSPPPTADYEAIRLYYLSAYTFNKIYTADADDCERLCLLVKIIPPPSAVSAAGKAFVWCSALLNCE